MAENRMVGEIAGRVLLVDDDALVLESLSLLLRSKGFTVHCCTGGAEALEALQENVFDVVLGDLNMPAMTGFQLCEKIRVHHPDLPFILITGNAELDLALTALRLRIFEFILKPFAPPALVAAVARAVHHRRQLQEDRGYRTELEKMVRETRAELATILRAHAGLCHDFMQRLTHAAEFRDEETGQHNARIGCYARQLAQTLGASPNFIDDIGLAAGMHDIGKIGIPDAILFKPGPLTPAEMAVIQKHPEIGSSILRNTDHPLLQMASDIALTHHERWDGSGYPHGLAGAAISLAGSIVMLADQYDALRSQRPYKSSFDHATACRIIIEGDEKTRPSHFDPQVLQAFIMGQTAFATIFDRLQDRPMWQPTLAKRAI